MPRWAHTEWTNPLKIKSMLEDTSHIHFIGIGGIGVSAVARVALAAGFNVSGSDVRESQLTHSIRDSGAKVTIGHHVENVEGTDLVVRSTAIPNDNIELNAARRQGIPIAHRSEILAALVARYQTIGVTGTHGKGTTAAMIAWIMEQAGFQPGFVIGGLLNNYQTNAKPGGGKWMVLEVDESDGSHHQIPPDYAVCNFLEADHLNYYADLDAIIGSMAAYIDDNPRLKRAFVNGDCGGIQTLIGQLAHCPITYGQGDGLDYRGKLLGKQQFPIRFEAYRRGDLLGQAELSIPGLYNVTNAMGAIAVATELGIPFERSAEALASFEGLENRFSIVRAGGLTIVKDYISHPTGIRRVLESAKDLASGRVFSIWKPYRYTLLSYLGDEYGTSFEGSDEVLITTMYAANEDPIEGIDTQYIVDKIRQSGMKVTFVPQDKDLIGALEDRVRKGDKVVFFGGDDFFEMADQWARRLGEE